MENFFNYISKPLQPEDVDVWFRVNNIIPEKLELYSDFTHSLNNLISVTYLGESEVNETKIVLSEDDDRNHFEWCWNKIIENFDKENIKFDKKGEHFDYFESFFGETFYNQKDIKIKNAVDDFFVKIFDTKENKTKSDIEIFTDIYKLLERSLKTA